MTKRQFNVRLPDITRGQIDRLCEAEKLTAAEVVMLAVDRFYQQRRAKMGDEVRVIEVEYSEDGMWGADGPAGYDVRASYARFSGQLEQALQVHYPGAEIYIRHTESDRIRIDGQWEGEHPEGPVVADIVGQVHGAWEWLEGDTCSS